MNEEITAMEYLQQLQTIDVKIQQDLERLAEMKHAASGVRAIRYDTDKVQTSPSDRVCADVARFTDFDAHINKEIDMFADAKEKIIGQINSLNHKTYIQILFKVYVQYKTLKQTADEIGMSYQYVISLHTKALILFMERYSPLYYLT